MIAPTANLHSKKVVINFLINYLHHVTICIQGWGREPTVRGQGVRKISRPRTDVLRTDLLEAKDRNGRDQGATTHFF